MDVSHRQDWEVLLMRSPWLLISQEKIYALECVSKIYNTFYILSLLRNSLWNFNKSYSYFYKIPSKNSFVDSVPFRFLGSGLPLNFTIKIKQSVKRKAGKISPLQNKYLDYVI